LYFVMSVRRQWAKKYPPAEELKEEFGIPKLPALSVANIRMLLLSVMPLRQFTPEQARRVVTRHLENRARSTGSRCRQQEQERQGVGGIPPGAASGPPGTGRRHKREEK
jgi:hypothetical protein